MIKNISTPCYNSILTLSHSSPPDPAPGNPAAHRSISQSFPSTLRRHPPPLPDYRLPFRILHRVLCPVLLSCRIRFSRIARRVRSFQIPLKSCPHQCTQRLVHILLRNNRKPLSSVFPDNLTADLPLQKCIHQTCRCLPEPVQELSRLLLRPEVQPQKHCCALLRPAEFFDHPLIRTRAQFPVDPLHRIPR